MIISITIFTECKGCYEWNVASFFFQLFIYFVHSVSNVRITLDEKVSTGLYRTDLFDREAARLPVLDPGRAVVEVKFDHFLPDHLNAALRDIPMVRLAVSKYVKCLGVLE